MKPSDKIVVSVIEKFATRSEVGQVKYGTTLDRKDLSTEEWLNHLQEELMDATLYVERIRQEVKQNGQSFITITAEAFNDADKIIHEGYTYIRLNDILLYK